VNEPVPSATFAALFPEGVAAAELRGPGEPARLKPEEARNVERAVAKRVQEFAAGRQCARHALRELGFADEAIPVQHDRQPAWPAGIVGSITHTAGFCAAVVAERTRFAALGIDTEISGAVKPELWESICVTDEDAWLRALPPDERPAAVTLLFSAKEAFYKCQYPLAGEHLSFNDVVVTVQGWGQGEGAFRVRAVRSLALFQRAGAEASLRGSYRLHEQFVSAGMCLPAAQAGPRMMR
jgi:4'-phosphopantetheinyl transferase EntD